MRLNAELYEWLSLATDKSAGGWKSMIHVCDEAIWTSDNMRLHCVGNLATADSVIASYLANNVTELKNKIKSKSPSDIPHEHNPPPNITEVFSKPAAATFMINPTISRSLKHISKISNSVELTIANDDVLASCEIPVFGVLPKTRIGKGDGRAVAKVNSAYLCDATMWGGIVEMPSLRTHPLRVRYKCGEFLQLTALIAGILPE
jgi:hypothetical protein